MKKIENAKISSTMLGYEDHGLFTAVLYLEFSGGSQGFGLRAMQDANYAVRFIQDTIRTVGVDSWEDLKGKYVRAEYDLSRVYKIGHLISPVWFDPEELSREIHG